jgi:histidine racemase
MDFERLVTADPSGNITAIVFDPTPRSRMPDVAAIIQSHYQSVERLCIEQVLFVERNGDGSIHAQMAGGEFCGNAARALGYVLTGGQKGSVTFKMSGTSAPVTFDVTEGSATLTTPMLLRMEAKDFEGEPLPIVHLEGISHAIMEPSHDFFPYLRRSAANENRAKIIAFALEDLGISEQLASALTFVEKQGNEISIASYVYVPAVDTLYPEQSCASGSVAAALAVCDDPAFSIFPLSVRQPSGENLQVTISPGQGRSLIKVAGSMRVIFDDRATGLRYVPDALAGRHNFHETRPLAAPAGRAPT